MTNTIRRVLSAGGPTSAITWLTCAMNNGSPNLIYLWGSPDGLTWTIMNGGSTVLAAYSGARDPAIIFLYGYWWMTTTYGGTSCPILKSTDLINWTYVTSITTGSGSNWAPQWFVDSDGTVRLYFSAVDVNLVGGHAIWETHALSADLTSWSSPAEVRYGNGNVVQSIDPSVVLLNGTYYMIRQDGGEIALATSTSPTTGFVQQWTSPFNDNIGQGEAPTLIWMGDRWRLYWIYNTFFDANGWFYAETTNIMSYSGWTTRVQLHTMDGYNHPVPIRNPNTLR